MLLIDRRNRAKAGNWIDEMRDELTGRIKEAKDITREKYEQIIDDMRPQYEAMKDVDAHEMNDLVNELKSHWKNISEEAKKQLSFPILEFKEEKEAVTRFFDRTK